MGEFSGGGTKFDYSINLPDDFEGKVSYAAGDISTAQQNYAHAYQTFSSGIDSIVSTFRSDIESLGYGPLTSVVDDIDIKTKNLQTKVTNANMTLSGLGVAYLAYSDVVLEMLDLVQKAIIDGDDELLQRFNNGETIDSLFNKPTSGLQKIIDSMYSGVKEGSKGIFAAIFKQKYGTGVFAADTTEMGIDFIENLKDGRISFKDLAGMSIRLLETTISFGAAEGLEAGLKGESNYFVNLVAENIGARGTIFATFGTAFVVGTFANIAISWMKDGELTTGEVVDGVVTASIGALATTVATPLVETITGCLGISASAGAIGIAAGAVVGLLTWVGTTAYQNLKEWAMTNEDGIPKEYQHMSIEELLDLMEKNGIDFSLPHLEGREKTKFGRDMTVYEATNCLIKAGADENMTTLIEAMCGADVPIDSLFMDGTAELTPAAQAIYETLKDPFHSPSLLPQFALGYDDDQYNEYKEYIEKVRQVFSSDNLQNDEKLRDVDMMLHETIPDSNFDIILELIEKRKKELAESQ